VAAAPFTAGASIPVAAGLMGTAGFASGLARESVQAFGGSTDTGLVRSVNPKKALAVSLGIDTTLGAATELGAQGLVSIGKAAIPKIVMRSAAKSEYGSKLIGDELFKTENNMTRIIEASDPKAAIAAEARPVDVSGVWTKTRDAVFSKRTMRGEIGQRLGGLTPKAAEIIDGIEKDMNIAAGGFANKQPLAGVITAKGALQRAAYKEASLTRREKGIFKDAARELDGIARAELKKVGPEATKEYERFLELVKIRDTKDGMMDLAAHVVGKVVKGGLSRPLVGAAIGGAGVGYEAKSVKGAVIGAGVGAAFGATPELSAWVLEKVMTNPAAAQYMKRAANELIRGNRGNAFALATRAVGMAEARQGIRDYIESKVEEQPRASDSVPGADSATQ